MDTRPLIPLIVAAFLILGLRMFLPASFFTGTALILLVLLAVLFRRWRRANRSGCDRVRPARAASR